jgi:hypothetical protein
MWFANLTSQVLYFRFRGKHEHVWEEAEVESLACELCVLHRPRSGEERGGVEFKSVGSELRKEYVDPARKF